MKDGGHEESERPGGRTQTKRNDKEVGRGKKKEDEQKQQRRKKEPRKRIEIEGTTSEKRKK
jgi:hypothetical protein